MNKRQLEELLESLNEYFDDVVLGYDDDNSSKGDDIVYRNTLDNIKLRIDIVKKEILSRSKDSKDEGYCNGYNFTDMY